MAKQQGERRLYRTKKIIAGPVFTLYDRRIIDLAVAVGEPLTQMGVVEPVKEPSVYDKRWGVFTPPKEWEESFIAALPRMEEDLRLAKLEDRLAEAEKQDRVESLRRRLDAELMGKK